YDLCREIGLDDELVSPATSTAQVWLDEQLRDLPRDSVLGVPLDIDLLRDAAIVSDDAVAAVEADRDRIAPVTSDHGDSVSRFVRQRLGDEVFERIVGPLLGGINAGDVERLSLAAAVPQFAAVADQPSLVRALSAQRPPATDPPAPVFYAHPRGMAHIVDTLCARLEADVRLSAPVRSIEPASRRWRLTGPGGALDADGVVVAVAAPDAAALLEPHVGPTPLSSIEHAGVVMVTFAWPRAAVPIDLHSSGFLVPRSAGLLLTAASIASSKWAHLGGDETVIVRASAGRFGDERALALDDAELVRALRADLHRTMGVEAPPDEVRVIRWPASFPQYTPGHLDRIDHVERAVAAVPGLAVAGAALRGVGIPTCIRSGTEAVTRLLGS
ncbi:MAG: protoporphyrinogen oxidase, partial [Acidimicrobiia bacterium]|nr:protoporphyrinogen oxidase [Acidimicrobiia bacterium]